MTPDPYSLLLALAFAAAAISWLGVALSWWRRPRLGGPARWAAPAAVVALVLDLLSVGVHLARGHRPGTEQAMGWGVFVAEHPAFAVVAILAVTAWVPGRGSRGIPPGD